MALARFRVGALHRRILRVEFLLGRHFAAAQFPHLAKPLELRLALRKRRTRLHLFRAGRVEGALGLAALRAQLVGIDRCQQLTDLHGRVVVGVHLLDDARDLGAHLHLRDGLEAAGRRDGDRQRALRGRYGLVGGGDLASLRPNQRGNTHRHSEEQTEQC